MRSLRTQTLVGGIAIATVLATGIASGALGPDAIERGKLVGSKGKPEDRFGYALAISGRTLVVSAPGSGAAGAAVVFKRPRRGGWEDAKQIARLTPSDAVAGFGEAVAISSRTIAVGNPFDGSSGAVYVFEKPPGGWGNASQDAKLTPADANAFDLGRSVAVSKGTVLAGASQSTAGGHAMQGAAYAFVKPVTGWADMNETARLYAGTGGPNDSFGRSVAIEGDTAVVGAPGRNVAGNTPNRGAVYVFVAPAGADTWANTATPTATLVGSEGAEGDFLGFSVDLSGPTIVAGAMQDDGSEVNQGSAYVFERPSGGWTDVIESTKLVASGGGFFDRLGYSVGVSGKAIVLGTSARDVAGATDQGAAYLYERPAAGWTGATPLTEDKELVTADGKAEDGFGQAVDITSDGIVAGSPGDDVRGQVDQGSAYALGRPK